MSIASLINSGFTRPKVDLDDVFSKFDMIINDYDPNSCERCNVPMTMDMDHGSYICNICGVLKKFQTEDYDSNNKNYNYTDSSSPLSITGSGMGSHKYVISSVNHVKNSQFKNTETQIRLFYREYDPSQLNDIDKLVISTAIEKYTDIQNGGKILRGSPRKAVMAALLHIYYEHNFILKKDTEIARMCNIQLNEYTNGLNIVYGYKADGKINIPDPLTPEQTFELLLKYYFSKLNIPYDEIQYDEDNKRILNLRIGNRPNYRAFVLLLLKFSIKYIISPQSQYPSKCSGAIFFLKKCPELNLTDNIIITATGVSKSTSETFVKCLNARLKDPSKPNTARRINKLLSLL